MIYDSYKPQEELIKKQTEEGKKADLAALKSAYDTSLMETQAAAEKIPETYQKAANDSAASYQREKRAFDEAALASGMNTGAGSQIRLSMLNQQARNQNDIAGQQAEAETNAQMQMAKLKSDYQSAIAQTNAKHDYEESARLLEEYRAAAQSQLEAQRLQLEADYERAQVMGSLGDFSVYANLGYTPDQIARLQAAYDKANRRSYTPQSPKSLDDGTGGDGGTGEGEGVSEAYKTALNVLINSAGSGYSRDEINRQLDYAVSDGALSQADANKLKNEAASKLYPTKSR